jgi:hypothetical protein
MHRPPAGALGRLRENRARYERAVEIVRHRARGADLEGVLRSATVAANFAWRAPIGRLADPELERLVVGSVRGDGGRARVDGTGTSGRVLHVLSEAYELGGHTRLAWRWIGRDARRSDVALTNQRSPLPAALRSTVSAAGGRVVDLRGQAPSLIERARALRALMAGADVVVYHVHPYDAVALAAAALPGTRPPIVYENHADFAFWLGLGCADVVSDFLDRGRQWSHELRGVPARRLGLLPLPVDQEPATTPATELRRALRLRPDDVVALSVASTAKMAPMWGQGFAGLLAQVLTAHPRLKVVLAGADAVGPWSDLIRRFPGRLFLLGTIGDPYSWYAAADIYLENYPLPAGTSVLEAALFGLPILTLRDLDARHGRGRLFQADSPGLAGGRHVVTTETDYVSHLRKLIRDPRLRAERGAAARNGVLAAHTGPGWAAALETLYAQARSMPAADLDEYPEPVEDLDHAQLLLPFMTGMQPTPDLIALAGPLGEALDDALLGDLFAVSNRDVSATVRVRVTPGWEEEPDGTRRLLALAARHPRLAVSLPFAAGDDAQGSRSVELVTRLLALNGNTTSDCGEVCLDGQPPRAGGHDPVHELPVTRAALDRLEKVVSSPLWQAATRDEPPAGAPAIAV